MSEIAAAREELDSFCQVDETLRHTRRHPKGPNASWLKTWEEELVPAHIFCGHLKLDDAQLQLTPPDTPAADVLIRHPDTNCRLEITIAYPAMHPDWNLDRRSSPGAQEALRSEMLNTVGRVSSTTPLTRNRRTGAVEYAEDDVARSVDASLVDWAQGLSFALKKKQRDDSYGRGSILIVYGYGMSGDFEYPRRLATPDQVLELMDARDFHNGFDRTFFFSWHGGWCREVGRGAV